jgi:hypothetical protein
MYLRVVLLLSWTLDALTAILVGITDYFVVFLEIIVIVVLVLIFARVTASRKTYFFGHLWTARAWTNGRRDGRLAILVLLVMVVAIPSFTRTLIHLHRIGNRLKIVDSETYAIARNPLRQCSS